MQPSLSFAQDCHIRIAAKDTRLCTMEVEVGLTPGKEATIIGTGRPLEQSLRLNSSLVHYLTYTEDVEEGRKAFRKEATELQRKIDLSRSL